MPSTADAIGRAIVRTLRSLRAAGEQRERRTTLLRTLAEESVALREHFHTPDGRPDWTGKTGAYRLRMRELYAGAGYTPDEAKSTQAAVRYHAGAVVRDRLSAEEVADLGLSKSPPREKFRVMHAERAGALRSAERESSDPDLVRALAGVLVLLQRTPEGRLSVLAGRDKELVVETLARIERRAARLGAAARRGDAESE